MPKDMTLEMKSIPVRIIKTIGAETALVERGDLMRRIVPLASVVNGEAILEPEWEMGIPYGLPWEEMIKLSATPQALADELRRNGIYTYADLEANPQAVMGCIQKVYGVELSTLFQAAHSRR